MDQRLLYLTARDDVFLTREALAMGFDDMTITRLARSGDIHRLRHGAYTTREAWGNLDTVARRRLVAIAAYKSAKSHVLFSHTSAADRFGVPVWDMPDLVHLSRTDGKAGRRAAGIVQHRGSVTVEDMTIRDGYATTSGTRTALDCTTVADTEHSLVLVNGLLFAGETSTPLMWRSLGMMTHWPDTLHTELVLRLADARCESVGESRTLFLCWSNGLPAPEPQYKIRNREGRVIARVDFAWPKFKVFLEFDGRVKYSAFLRKGESAADAVIREKRREEMICGLTGWRCIRIVWADLFSPVRTAQRILSTLNGQPWAA